MRIDRRDALKIPMIRGIGDKEFKCSSEGKIGIGNHGSGRKERKGGDTVGPEGKTFGSSALPQTMFEIKQSLTRYMRRQIIQRCV